MRLRSGQASRPPRDALRVRAHPRQAPRLRVHARAQRRGLVAASWWPRRLSRCGVVTAERSAREILLGYEVGSGRPITIPVRHLAVTGQTQESGKTTTLEALVARSGLRAIAFVTKRGERAFAGAFVTRRIQPYFRDRADWQFVDQLLEAQLREKNKFLRPWIIRICRNTRTLADVQREVKKGLVKAKGISEGVYTQLDAYLELIVPEIARASLAQGIELAEGLNVMDVSAFPTPMQMLFVQSALAAL